MIQTPVIFLIFAREQGTSRVFEEIRKARPPKLFIVADGPRNDEEKKLTDATRAVVEKIDWPCEVKKNYSEKNLGCRMRVWSGLDWAMNQLEHDTDGAIILEDDCVPDPTFFTFCEEMLEHYKRNEQIMHIGGTNFQQDNANFIPKYYFSRIAQIWGWATWKRAWKLYDGTLASWPNLKASGGLRKAFPNRLTYHYWINHFQKLYEGKSDTWDVAWTYTCFKENGFCIMPQTNLICNIGTAQNAAHKVSRFSNLPTSPLPLPLVHPTEIIINNDADLFTYKKIYGVKMNVKNSSLALMKDKLPFLFNYIKRLVK